VVFKHNDDDFCKYETAENEEIKQQLPFCWDSNINTTKSQVMQF
jgi:hypothetical protein